MFQALVSSARGLLNDLMRSWHRGRATLPVAAEVTAPVAANYAPLRRVLLTDEVGRTLFEEFAGHRAAERGDEETGWVLLGRREAHEAIVLATLPAGSDSDAGVAHIRFNSTGQAVASSIVRQQDRRLMTLGVVHTHPGSLRHPSDGDFRGDCQWVQKLRGKEGIFGIGTADGQPANGSTFAYQPKAHVQCLGELRFSWYALAHGDANYRPLPVDLTIGPDLARPLHALWPVLEAHGAQLERLHRQQANVRFEVLADAHNPGLVLTLRLVGHGQSVRVLLREKEVRYYLERDGQVLEADIAEECVDRGVYLMLAELASQP